MRALPTIAAGVLASFVFASVAGATHSQAVMGFATGRVADRNRIVCGVNVDGIRGLSCAGRGISRWAYDQRGVVRLRPGNPARVVRAGSDLLLAINGDLPRQQRPLIAFGESWTDGTYQCRLRSTGLACTTGRHGFVLSKSSLQMH